MTRDHACVARRSLMIYLGIIILPPGCDLPTAVNDGGEGLPLSCGNARCDFGETQAACPQDCDDAAGRTCTIAGNECADNELCISGRCVVIRDTQGEVVCGDDICSLGETALNCAMDCIREGSQLCGNDVCESAETDLNCAIDCVGDDGPGDALCGDNVCEPSETVLNCPSDCVDDDDDGAPDGCTPTCITQTQCDDGDPCTADACVSAVGCGAAQVCRNRPLDCPFGQSCVGGQCREQQLCFVDTDCAIGQDCVNGQCVTGP